MGWYTLTTILAAVIPVTVVAANIVHRIIQYYKERGEYPLPPGPIPLPLLGSALSINGKRPWLSYTKWKARYGDIMYIRLLDTDVIVLNSTDVATELIDKRSRIYSDRPFIPTLVPYGHDCNFSLARYGEHWRLCRRIFHQTFHADAALSFRQMQLRRARQLVQNILDDHNEYPFHFSTFAAAVAMSAVYDYEPNPRNDSMVSIMDNYIRTSLPALGPGKILLIKIFPFLLHIPVWFPWSWIGREANEARAWRNKVVETPYGYVRKHLASKGQKKAGMVSDHISRMENFSGSYRSQYETALKHAAATAFLASTETTSSTLLTFTLAMVKNPRVWKRAQVEIDAVVGTERLPEFADRPSLPYVNAILRETLRWRPVTPMLAPHAATCNDIYKGYYIPEGATIFVNAWGISRDEARYPDAEKFIPERFLNMEAQLTDDDPSEFVFGFGRRKCPGRYTADASLWSAMATMLATLDFNLAKDANGKDITFTPTFASGITDHPHPFPCQLAPRAHISKVVTDRVFTK